MKLTRFNYSESSRSGEQWRVEELAFGSFNLVVGRNAAGKSRLLRGINRSAAVMSGETPANPGRFEFEITLDAAAPEAKAEWARRTQYFPFSGEMLLKVPSAGTGAFTRADAATVFKLGCETFGPSFATALVERIATVGYPVTEIFDTEKESGGCTLILQETKRRDATAFRHLSQAQQRTIVLLIFVTYLEFKKEAATLLIDDFAEGLDFERSTRLARIFFPHYEESTLQLILSTNDRYVMNVVPLEHWTVLVEEGSTTKVFNYGNSKEKFDSFKFTGLCNFDFFSMDFAQEP